MAYQPINTKQVWRIIALAVIVWIPGAAIILMKSSGALHFSDRRMAVIGAVNMIIGVGALVVAYRKWISKIKS